MYNNQRDLTEDFRAALVYNTCLTIAADESTFATVYEILKSNNSSLVVKDSLAEGWNNAVHIDKLTSTYKALYFKDISQLSKTLTDNHFRFFYERLKPIDEDFASTIQQYESISLKGNHMLGHNFNISKLMEMYKLRQRLF